MGKSRLLTEMVETAGGPYLFTTAIKNAAPSVQLMQVMADPRSSRVPLPEVDLAFAEVDRSRRIGRVAVWCPSAR